MSLSLFNLRWIHEARRRVKAIRPCAWVFLPRGRVSGKMGVERPARAWRFIPRTGGRVARSRKVPHQRPEEFRFRARGGDGCPCRFLRAGVVGSSDQAAGRPLGRRPRARAEERVALRHGRCSGRRRAGRVSRCPTARCRLARGRSDATGRRVGARHRRRGDVLLDPCRQRVVSRWCAGRGGAGSRRRGSRRRCRARLDPRPLVGARERRPADARRGRRCRGAAVAAVLRDVRRGRRRTDRRRSRSGPRRLRARGSDRRPLVAQHPVHHAGHDPYRLPRVLRLGRRHHSEHRRAGPRERALRAGGHAGATDASGRCDDADRPLPQVVTAWTPTRSRSTPRS